MYYNHLLDGIYLHNSIIEYILIKKVFKFRENGSLFVELKELDLLINQHGVSNIFQSFNPHFYSNFIK